MIKIVNREKILLMVILFLQAYPSHGQDIQKEIMTQYSNNRIKESNDFDSLTYFKKLAHNFEQFLYRRVRFSPKYDTLLIDGKPCTIDNMIKACEKYCPECIPLLEKPVIGIVPISKRIKALRRYNETLKKKYKMKKIEVERNEPGTKLIDSLIYYKKKNENYFNYYTRMIRLSEEIPFSIPFFNYYKGTFPYKISPDRYCKKFGFVIDSMYIRSYFSYFKTELNVSESFSPQAYNLFKESRKNKIIGEIFFGTGYASSIVGLGGFIVGLIFLPMEEIGKPGVARNIVKNFGLVTLGGLCLSISSIPFYIKSKKKARKGYIQYDRDLRDKYTIPDKIAIKN